MKQIDLKEYLEAHGIECVREDNRGYFVMRNPETARISGLPRPKDGQLIRAATVCQICRNLTVAIPECAKDGETIIDLVRSQHLPNELK